MKRNKNELIVKNDVYNNRFLSLAVLVSVPFMATIDTSIVNVALPTLRESLNITMADSSWIVSSYLIAITTVILLFGRLGDIKGKDKIFLNGLIVFVIGSLCCGISFNFSLLIFSRVLQGVGAAMIMANNQGLITQIFPKSERGRALGMSSSAVALGSILGPALGGLIITYLSWHFIFLINIPIGVIAFIIGTKYLPHTAMKENVKINKKNTLLLCSGILIFFLVLLFYQKISYINISIVLLFLLGLLLIIHYVKIEKKSPHPLIDFSLFKIPTFSINLICAILYFIVLNSINIVLPFYLSDVLHFNAKNISLVMLVNPIVLFFAAPIGGTVSDKIGPKKVTIAGLAFISLTVFLMSFLKETTPILYLIIVLGLMGCAMGNFNAPNTNLIMSSVPKEKFGIAGSCNALVRNIGMSLGTCLCTTTLYMQMSKFAGYRIIDSAKVSSSIFTYGMKKVFLMLTFIMIIALILSLLDKFYFKNN